MKFALSAFVFVCAGAVSASVQPRDSRIYKLEELAWPRIDALDRARTMFILPIGMLEEHGPHLPIAADTFGVAFEAKGVAARVSQALPAWTIVMMPLIPYGESGANEIGGDLVHPGTYGIRQSTLRSLVADIGAQVAQNGFTSIFVLTGHAAPTHGIAVNEACDFVSETFGVTMLHVSGLFRADPSIQAEGGRIAARHFSAAELSSFGLDVHAGLSETSVGLFLRPDLVDRGYRKLPSLPGGSRLDLQRIARTEGWIGYFSSPARATAAYGRAVETWWVDGLSDIILRAAGGNDASRAPRAPDTIDPALETVLGDVLDNERAFESKLDQWLARRRPR